MLVASSASHLLVTEKKKRTLIQAPPIKKCPTLHDVCCEWRKVGWQQGESSCGGDAIGSKDLCRVFLNPLFGEPVVCTRDSLRQDKLFGPVGLGMTPGLSQGQARFVLGTNPGFLLMLHSGSPVCPRDRPSLSLRQARG